jgi:hypothetical protein
VLSIPVVKDNEAEADAVCDEIKVIPSPALTCANAVTLATEASLIPAGKITPPVVMLFAAALVIVPLC